MLNDTMRQRLLDEARRARDRAYAPYSRFPVGAAVLTSTQEIFSGCNIENASFGAAVCAERVAIFQAVAAGHRRFTALAVVADTFSLPGALPLLLGSPFFLLRTPYTPTWCIQVVEGHPLGQVLESLAQLPERLAALSS